MPRLSLDESQLTGATLRGVFTTLSTRSVKVDYVIDGSAPDRVLDFGGDKADGNKRRSARDEASKKQLSKLGFGDSSTVSTPGGHSFSYLNRGPAKETVAADTISTNSTAGARKAKGPAQTTDKTLG
jgi:hypothetical protein